MCEEPRTCPWTRKALKRLGEALVAQEQPTGDDPSFETVALWYEEVKGYVQASLYVLDWTGFTAADAEPDITARVKTDGTLREKLIREPTFPLHNVQDIAGVRFEADMTLTQQNAVVEKISQ